MKTYPVKMDIHLEVDAFFDAATKTISYNIKDPTSEAKD